MQFAGLNAANNTVRFYVRRYLKLNVENAISPGIDLLIYRFLGLGLLFRLLPNHSAWQRLQENLHSNDFVHLYVKRESIDTSISQLWNQAREARNEEY